MAALAANNTARYFLHYKANFRNHTVSFRYDDGGVVLAPDVVFLAALTVILNACASFMPNDWVDQSAEFIPSGSFVSIPAGVPLLRITGANAALAGQAPGYLDFTGRSVDGRQGFFYLLGASVNAFSAGPATTDWRLNSAEDPAVAAIRTALDIAPLVTIGGLAPLWKSYMNFGYNSYWQGEVRT